MAFCFILNNHLIKNQFSKTKEQISFLLSGVFSWQQLRFELFNWHIKKFVNIFDPYNVQNFLLIKNGQQIKLTIEHNRSKQIETNDGILDVLM